MVRKKQPTPTGLSMLSSCLFGRSPRSDDTWTALQNFWTDLPTNSCFPNLDSVSESSRKVWKDLSEDQTHKILQKLLEASTLLHWKYLQQLRGFIWWYMVIIKGLMVIPVIPIKIVPVNQQFLCFFSKKHHEFPGSTPRWPLKASEMVEPGEILEADAEVWMNKPTQMVIFHSKTACSLRKVSK